MGLKALGTSLRTGRRGFMFGLLAGPMAAKAVSAAAQPPSDGPLYLQEFRAFDGKTPDQMLRELADREEMTALIARYAHLIAHGLSVADLFTEDGAFIVRLPGRPVAETRGRAALQALYAHPRDISVSAKPMIHNYLFEVMGDEARGTCSNEVRIVEKGESFIGSGYYQDRFRRENGRWRFAVRDATFYHWVPLKQGWAPAAAS
jgi:hypothetical protein